MLFVGFLVGADEFAQVLAEGWGLVVLLVVAAGVVLVCGDAAWVDWLLWAFGCVGLCELWKVDCGCYGFPGTLVSCGLV